jgi:hypothetical protein
MAAWKLLVPLATVVTGGGIVATTLVSKFAFSCIVPWHSDTTCGIPKMSLPPGGGVFLEVKAVTKDGKKWDGACPIVAFYDAASDKQLHQREFMCENFRADYMNPSTDKDQLVYVRINVKEKKDVDIRGEVRIVK